MTAADWIALAASLVIVSQGVWLILADRRAQRELDDQAAEALDPERAARRWGAV